MYDDALRTVRFPTFLPSKSSSNVGNFLDNSFIMFISSDLREIRDDHTTEKTLPKVYVAEK